MRRSGIPAKRLEDELILSIVAMAAGVSRRDASKQGTSDHVGGVGGHVA